MQPQTGVRTEIPTARTLVFASFPAASRKTSRVRCNAICPDFFPAEQNRKLLDEQRVANIMNGAPTPRCGDPNEPVGAAILLLSKKAGSYMTGSAVYVDGGLASSRT